ncbi:iron uptake system protein EfeO [Prescottella equi]|jgi:iron uptake system component EfeO|uniref:Peptidase M75 n=2 Tax=Rhodococcus hoagii TaxID=43767 RepID=A0AAE5MKG0_RHOHA|nr:iron uptake system protein EfeO [Prescottella equi]GBF14043.1 iron uptake system component EfeO precursor [Rhodococcus sp. Br-6]ERN46635.1 peptidase [Prescottella equi NBRC 101255 = C 7]MBM4470220.1 peptidase M75 family protein [Prescottella equi]MBM4482294.1 peptidase M75 family protein [Prescottella equi]MBM4535724.1 peptidase M75 family protein [Prescottella equi]
MTVTRKVPLVRRTTSALALLAIAPLALAACTSKSTADAEAITVTATDSTCDISGNSAETGNTTFSITNNGSKVTEFYVFGAGDRVMGEVENVGPGLTRQLIVNLAEAGTYHTACKPGMVGNGIRSEFVVTGDSVAATDQDGRLTEAADGYKRYVDSQLTALQETVTAFVASIKAGDVAAAKAQYPLTRTYYERIEPIAESFPDDLDPRIDLREVDVEPGWNWTGFHRLEKDLWVQGLQPDTNAIADQLVADIQELADGVAAPDFVVDPIQVAGGAQTLLDEIARTKITGEEDIFSHTDLYDFQANADGSQAAIASLRPILDDRNPELAARIDQRFADLDAELAQFRQGDGFVSYETVTEPQRQALSQKIDALSAEVSQVQGVVAGQ